ncbi:MAG: hypothetical protein AB7E60_02075 [Sphingobium sp.]
MTKPTGALKAIGLACLISAANPAVSAALAAPSPSAASVPGAPASLAYADVADLVDGASLVAEARIARTVALPPETTSPAPPGHRRLYVEAQVTALIRGDGGISPTISYLYDAPLDRRGKTPKLTKMPVLLFARPGTRPGQIQLIARDAQITATPAQVARVKAIVSDFVAPDAPPQVIGLGDAFHVAGTVAGEGETQIFLRTSNGEPVSLSILRRPGQPPRWAVALGEIVDEAARPPEPGTLLWYRLACALPPALPPRSTRSLSVHDAEAARADYQLVLQALGQCGRTRPAA